MSHFDDEHIKIFGEFCDKQTIVLDNLYKFGAASVLTSLSLWCDELDEKNITDLNSNEIRKAFEDWINTDKELNDMYERMYKDRVKKRKRVGNVIKMFD